MERELWTALCALAARLANRGTLACYADETICAVYWWAVIHDRPTSWACRRENWPVELIRRALPSQPTMSRRLRTAAVEQLLLEVEQALATLTARATTQTLAIDGKALPVGRPSKDADAACCRGVKGYKLHAVWGDSLVPTAWALAPLNVSERRVARALAADLPGEGYLLGDSQYDVNDLYDVAAQSGYQLLAVQQRPSRRLGHRPHSPHRIRGLELLRTAAGKQLYRKRRRIEHRFAQLTSFVGGLAPLPFWVRRFHRVRLWVHSKLLINAVHQMKFWKPTLAVE
jgi:Transposase DDE domain